MDLNLFLWIGGMIFSLAVFMAKVGCGLGWGKSRWSFTTLILLLYLTIFIIAAVFTDGLMNLLMPIVKQGPWLHAIIGVGMMAWGGFILFQAPASHSHAGRRMEVSVACGTSHLRRGAIFLLVLPCPVCLTAIIFSTWAALQVFKWPSWLVGLGLGLTFTALTLGACVILRFISRGATTLAGHYGLALSLLGIGAYFLASLFLPGQIEAARSIYQSFLPAHSGPNLRDQLGVLLLLAIALLVGFVTKQNRPVVK